MFTIMNFFKQKHKIEEKNKKWKIQKRIAQNNTRFASEMGITITAHKRNLETLSLEVHTKITRFDIIQTMETSFCVMVFGYLLIIAKIKNDKSK